jgi:hypothetical protein
MIIPYKPKTVLTSLFVVSILTAISFLFFRRLDNIINVDLYHYGLVFNYGWADQYWTSSNLFLYCQTLALILLGNSIAFFLSHIRNRNTFSGTASSLLLFAGSGLSFFSLYLLYRMDYIVNHDFYSYGLTFSAEWFTNYSLYYRMMLFLALLASMLAFASATVIYGSTRKVRIVPAKLLDTTLTAVGTIALAFSIVYSSSILALIGLGLLFWGVTFTYISNDAYVKKILLDTTALSEIEMLNHLLSKLEYASNPIYLPPQYLGYSDTYKAYIPKFETITIPKREEFSSQKPDSLIDIIENPPGVLITPPGAELARLAEKTLKTDFNKADLQYLQQNLPDLLIDELEFTQYFNMEIENEKILVMVEGSVYRRSNKKSDQPSISSLFGSPLSSAIACILSKVTGKPVMKIGTETDFEDKPVTIEYVLLQSS